MKYEKRFLCSYCQIIKKLEQMNQSIYKIDTETPSWRTNKRKHYENLNDETWLYEMFAWGKLI